MKLEGKYKFEATQERVWEVFTNPRHLERKERGTLLTNCTNLLL